jgi:uncharacterized membrane protein (Fun14 family)
MLKKEQIAQLEKLRDEHQNPAIIMAYNDKIAAANEELKVLQMTTKELEEYNKKKLENRKPIDLTLPKMSANIEAVVKTGGDAFKDSDAYGYLAARLEESADKAKLAIDKLEKEKDRAAMIADDFGWSVAGAFSDGMKVLMDALVSGGKVDGNAMAAAIIQPFASMTIKLGEMAIANGVAAIALKQLAKVPALSIAAGVALVSLGQLAMAGVSSITSGGSATSPKSVTSFTGGSGVFMPKMDVKPLEVYGKISGADILLSSERAAQLRKR